jgi:hypothetical protein
LLPVLDSFRGAKHAGRVNVVRRCLGLALLAPMLILAVSASSVFVQRCRMSGMTSFSACCPEADAGEPPAQSSVSESGCCERVVVELVKPVADVACGPQPPLDARPMLCAHPPVAAVLVDPRAALVFGHADPPRVRRLSLPLLHHSLLI